MISSVDKLPDVKAEQRRLVGTLAIVLLAPVAVVTVAFGGTEGSPRDQAWEQCQHYPYPQGLAPYPEAVDAGGTRTLFPLGLICTYDNPSTSAAPVSVAHPQWDATAVASLATLGVLAGVAMIVRTRPSPTPRSRAAEPPRGAGRARTSSTPDLDTDRSQGAAG